VGATSDVSRRMGSEVADDARAVAATAVAARRLLRPEPQVDDDVDGADYEVEALYASADDGEIVAAETAVLTAVSSGAAAGERRGNGVAPDADTLVTAQNRGATAENTAVLPDAPDPAETTEGLPADPPGTAESTAALPADPPGTAESTAALPAEQPGTAGTTASLPAEHPGTAGTTGFLPDGPRPTPARRRDGVVVPLRVPLRLRLRAATGLVFMVMVLGFIAAAVVVALALAAGQVLSNF
jgi:hypothetical protein